MSFKLVDIYCKVCDNKEIDVMLKKDETPICSECGGEADVQLNFAGYTMYGRGNAGTTRPANSGAFNARSSRKRNK